MLVDEFDRTRDGFGGDDGFHYQFGKADIQFFFLSFRQWRFVEKILLEMAEFAIARHAAVLGVELHDLSDDVFAVGTVEFGESLGFDFSGFHYHAVKIKDDCLPVKAFHD